MDFGFNPEHKKRDKIPKGVIKPKEGNEIHTAPIVFRNGCSTCIGEFTSRFICPACGKPVDIVKEEK